MNKLSLALAPIALTAVIFTIPGAAAAQSRHVAGAQCPPPKLMEDEITEVEAQNLAQQYADKNLKGFKVEKFTRNSGGRKAHDEVAYGGGYDTVCFSNNGDAHHSVEYSFDVKNSKGSRRILLVDQFGYVRQYRGIDSASR